MRLELCLTSFHCLAVVGKATEIAKWLKTAGSGEITPFWVSFRGVGVTLNLVSGCTTNGVSQIHTCCKRKLRMRLSRRASHLP
jgi:hypothetical protein